ncbi:MAG TPA: diguanylate cyclase, partial [Pseudomonadales bacterium]|nr:diguanylate cyclase [Pseudomonadales bacterium]
ERYKPDANELELVRRLTQHAGIAIQSHRRGEALRLSERRYRMLYDETPTMFFTLDPNGTVLSVNQFGADHLGFTVSELIGRQFSTLHVPADKLIIDDNIEKCQQLRPAMVTWEASRLCKDGREIRVRDRARAVPSFNQQIHLLIASEDITEAHHLAEKLSYQASHDPLTGLPNRREFEHQLQKLIESAQQEDIQHALFYVDLDQFKLVNDTCGHAAGDELLRQLATLLHQHTRKTDLLARLGGDEFGVLLERCSLEQASGIATNIRNAIAGFRFLWQDKIFSLGASIGVVAIDKHVEHLDGILAAADTACYEAKEQGRNRIHVVRQNDEVVLRRRGEMQWVSRIQRAYEEDRLQLFLQDIIPTQQPHGVHSHYEILL